MCGIAGEFRFDGVAPDQILIERMTARLARRGPDASGTYSDGPLAFGHRRLAIIDLSPLSNQPMVDDKLGLALVFNGTIYNYPELRVELHAKGYQFFSDGDTEVILKAYAEWGEACTEHLHGAFAFAIWNRKAQTLFLARDRLGIKPLYYSQDKQCVRFASTTQALLAAGGVDTVSTRWRCTINLRCMRWCPRRVTILKGIRKVAPATSLTIDQRGEVTPRCYWNLRAQRPTTPLTEDEWVEAIHASLKAAVKKRLVIADVKVGVLLSGGLDSSLLVALLAEQDVPDLLTFSVGFEDQPEERGHEFEYSDLVAEHFGTRHHQFHIANSEVLKRLPEAVDNMAEPMVSQDAVAFYLLAEQVSKSVKVVQSGQGADEIFGGYYWYGHMQDDTAGTYLDRFRRHYFDRDHDEYLQTVMPAYHGVDYTADRQRLSERARSRYLSRPNTAHGCHHAHHRRPGQARGQHGHGLGLGSARAFP